MLSIIIAVASGFIAGTILVIILDVIALWYWLGWVPKEDPKLVPRYENVKHSKDLAEYCKTKGAAPSESCMFLNLLIAFLWREWRDSTSTKSYFINKMNLEFQELLLYKAAGKLLQNIQVKDYCLGDSLPIIKKATVMKIQSRSPDEVAQELDLALDIEYSGGFLISLVVDLIFGKTVSLAVKLNSLQGRVRLQFTRVPCTHWSFSFYEDPEMDIEVESQFNGRNLAKLTTLIKNQIIKSVKRKHTLPRYKVRYKPFFRPPVERDGKPDIFVHNSLITVGRLTVEVMDCSRLPSVIHNSRLYCVLSVDSLPWKEDMPVKSSLWPVHEVVLRRALSGSIGVTIKQSFHSEYEFHKELIVIDTISPQSPASLVDIKRDDILLSINDVNIDSLKQAVRLIKNGGEKLVFKLQRPPNASTVNFHDQEISDMENEEDGISRSVKDAITPDFESSLSINACDEDSDGDGDDFVNIVVKELEEQMGESDETARKILRKVSQSKNLGISINLKHEIDESIEVASSGFDISNPVARADVDINDGCKNAFSLAEDTRERSSMQVRKRKATLRPKELSLKDPIAVSGEEKPLEMMLDETDRILSMEHNDNDAGVQINGIEREILHVTDKNIDIDNDSSDSQSFDSFDGDGEWDNISQQTLYNTEELLHKTSTVSCNVDPVWNEIFTFDVEKHHRFLNVCIWSRSDERYNKDILIGYSSISLMEISLECLSTTSGKHTQSYPLAPPYSRAGVSRTSLRLLMPGLKPETCNGDIKLSLCYKPSINDCVLINEKRDDDGIENTLHGDKHTNEFNGNFDTDDRDQYIEGQQMHEFVAMQFYFPTRCDYCQKKVWTKTAVQCRVCAMVSHKRCINNAHSNTYCTRHGVRAKPHAWSSADDIALKTSGCKQALDSENGKKRGGEVQESTELGQRDLEHKGMEKKDSMIAYVGKQNIDTLNGSYPDNSNSDMHGDPNWNGKNPIFRSRISAILSKENSKIMHEAESMEHPSQRNCGSVDRMDSMTNAAISAQEAGKELFSSTTDENQRMFFGDKLPHNSGS